MTVNYVRSEAYAWKYGKRCLTEIAVLLYIPLNISIDIEAVEVVLIIYEIYRHSFILHIHNTYILLSPAYVHMEMCQIFHLAPILLRQTHIVRHYDTDIIFISIKLLW